MLCNVAHCFGLARPWTRSPSRLWMLEGQARKGSQIEEAWICEITFG